jgi:hypothetical protein
MASGHALIGTYLKRIGQRDKDECWWCGPGRKQTRGHLFRERRAFIPERRAMWKKARKEMKWKKMAPPTVRKIFKDKRATGAIMESLKETGVGYRIL